MPTFYYEVLEIRDGKALSHVYTDLKEAVKMGRYLAQDSKREVLLRKVTDLAYLTANDAEMVGVDWKCLNAINAAY